MITESQRRAVLFCVDTLRIPFRGDLQSFADVSRYLTDNLEDAKLVRKQMALYRREKDNESDN
jgi:hypothetical protein